MPRRAARASSSRAAEVADAFGNAASRALRDAATAGGCHSSPRVAGTNSSADTTAATTRRSIRSSLRPLPPRAGRAVLENDPLLRKLQAQPVGLGEVATPPGGVAGLDHGLDVGGQGVVPGGENAEDLVRFPDGGRDGGRSRRVEGVLDEGRVDLAQKREEDAQRLGRVQIVVEGRGPVRRELRSAFGRRKRARLAFVRSRGLVDAQNRRPDSLDGGRGSGERLPGEVEFLAVGHREEKVAHGHRVVSLREDVVERVEVALGLRHFLAVDEEMLAVHPEIHELLPRRGLALGDLVFVVREDVVHAPRVNVEVISEVLRAHGRALDVPARAAGPPGRIPGRLPRLRGLPENEVLDVLFLVLVVGHALAAASLRKVDPGETAVGRESRDPEVHRPLGFVGVAAFDELRDHRDHLGDVLGRARVPFRALEAEPVEVPEEEIGIPARELGQGLAGLRRALDRLVVDVGQVHDLGDPEALCFQVPAQDVFPEERPQVPDVGDVVDRRAAGVEADMSRLDRHERLDRAAQRVVRLQRHQSPFSFCRRIFRQVSSRFKPRSRSTNSIPFRWSVS